MAINRIWTPTPSEDIFDFYLDNDSTPQFSIKFIDLFSGKQFPFVAPLCGNQLGGVLQLPAHPISKELQDCTRGKKIQFHQIQYRMYEAGAKVKSFSLSLNADEKAALTKIDELWNKEQNRLRIFMLHHLPNRRPRLAPQPGETKSVFS